MGHNWLIVFIIKQLWGDMVCNFLQRLFTPVIRLGIYSKQKTGISPKLIPV